MGLVRRQWVAVVPIVSAVMLAALPAPPGGESRIPVPTLVRRVRGPFCLSMILLAVVGCEGHQGGGAEPVVDAGTASISVTAPPTRAVIPHASQTAMAQKIEQLYRSRPAGVTGSALNAALSKNGRLLAVGYTGGYVVVWDVDHAQHPVLGLRSTAASVPANLAVSDDGRLLAAAFGPTSSLETAISVWNIPQGKHLADFVTTDAPVLKFSANGTRLIAAGADMAVFNIATKHLTSSSPPFCFKTGSAVDAAGFGPDGLSVVIVLDSCFFVWTPGMTIRQLFKTGELNGYAVSPDGTKVAASTGDEVSVWDVRTGRETAVLRTSHPMNAIQTAAFLGDSQRLAVGGGATSAAPLGTRMVEVFDVAKAQLIAHYNGAGKGLAGTILYSPYDLILALTSGVQGSALDVFALPAHPN
jgi:hypothetical protein